MQSVISHPRNRGAFVEGEGHKTTATYKTSEADMPHGEKITGECNVCFTPEDQVPIAQLEMSVDDLVVVKSGQTEGKILRAGVTECTYPLQV